MAGNKIKKILTFIIAKFFSCIIFFTDIFSNYYSESKNKFKFNVIKKEFGAIGNNSIIRYPWFDISGLKNIIIGKNFFARQGLYLATYDFFNNFHYSPQIIFGDNVGIGRNCQITAINKIVIGNDVLIGSHVLITDHSHGNTDEQSIQIPPLKRKLESKGPVVIGNNVWIGSGVAILPNVTIGDNSIIGANSVVTKSFPTNSVIGGNPAKLINNRIEDED